MLSIENISVYFGGFTLLDSISFVLNKRERIALVGKNGAGKSTMLKIIAGIQSPSDGAVNYPKEVRIGYLPQHKNHEDCRTVYEEAEQAFSRIFELEAEIERMNQELAERSDYDSEDYHKLIDRHTFANEHLLMMGGMNYKADLEKTLLGLGFRREDFARQTSEFSGGWRMRIELAKLLLQRNDVLLLDEPTNHLDIESIQWLEQYLQSQPTAVILVSHDKAFIDNLTTRTIEITLGRIYDYKVNYSKYVELRAAHLEQQRRAYENQQKQIQETEDFIERFRYKATKAVQVQSRIKQLEKIDLIEVDEVDASALRLKFPPSPRSGDYPVIADGLRKSYGAHVVFQQGDFIIERGEKVAFVGKNGEGKSTMVKCIMGEIPFDGVLKVGHNVKIGYFAQNQAALLDENKTVFETIDEVAQGDIRTQIRNILGGFMFGGEASEKKVGVLSGGERTRLAMIRLLLEPVNLLILDEPTNHLDMRTKDILKEALLAYDGTLIVVSHDRDFLNGLVDKVYEFGNQRIREHLGGIYAFLERKKMESLDQLNQSNTSSLRAVASKSEEKQVSEGKMSFEARKELNKQIKRLEKQAADQELQIAQVEQEIALLEEKMTLEEHAGDANLYIEHSNKKQSLTQIEEEWTLTQMEIDEIRSAMG